MRKKYKGTEQAFAYLADKFGIGANAPQCDHPNCEQHGEFKAPKSRKLDEYYLFCLDHVRLYNARWDYYRGMEPDEIEESRYNDITWNRPTWKFASLGDKTTSKNWHCAKEDIRNNGGGFDPNDSAEYAENDSPSNAASPYARDIHDALLVLGIKTKPHSFVEISTLYKELAKKFHPDANAGDSEKEDKLKEINQAYTLLRQFRDMF